jgi:hypothetical protein
MVEMSKHKAVEPTHTAAHRPSPAAIAGRAYEIFLDRGGQHGHNLEDWLQAERELLSGQARPSAKNLPLGLRLLE